MIERHIPVLPLSRDARMLPGLKTALAIYRMVFGQPRQDDLLEYLMQRLTPEKLAAAMECVRIDLTPPAMAVRIGSPPGDSAVDKSGEQET